jgi:hypothetical protein
MEYSREERQARILAAVNLINGIRQGLCPCGYMGTISPKGACFKCGAQWDVYPKPKPTPVAPIQEAPKATPEDLALMDLEAWPNLNRYLAHASYCSSAEAEICDCGLRQAKERGRLAYKAIRALVAGHHTGEAGT